MEGGGTGPTAATAWKEKCLQARPPQALQGSAAWALGWGGTRRVDRLRTWTSYGREHDGPGGESHWPSREDGTLGSG